MNQNGTYTIRMAAYAGKWIELWWEENPAPSDPFEHEGHHFSSKIGYFDEALPSDLSFRVLNHGVRGLKVTIADGHIVKVFE